MDEDENRKSDFEILEAVQDAFEYQYDGLIDDVLEWCDETLTPEEREWASQNLTVKIVRRK